MEPLPLAERSLLDSNTTVRTGPYTAVREVRPALPDQ